MKFEQTHTCAPAGVHVLFNAHYFCTHHGLRDHAIDQSHLQDASLPEADQIHSQIRTQEEPKETYRSQLHHFARGLHMWCRAEHGEHNQQGSLNKQWQTALQCSANHSLHQLPFSPSSQASDCVSNHVLREHADHTTSNGELTETG